MDDVTIPRAELTAMETSVGNCDVLRRRVAELEAMLERSPEHAYHCDANDYITEEAQKRECDCIWNELRRAALSGEGVSR